MSASNPYLSEASRESARCFVSVKSVRSANDLRHSFTLLWEQDLTIKKNLLASIFLFAFCSLAMAEDWPQWMGTERDGVWREQGIIDAIPKSGLPVKWRVPVKLGYSGPAVADGKVFVMDYEPTEGEPKNSPESATKLNGSERLLCLDAETGKLLWKHSYPQPYSISYPGGPRCTPTVDGDRVYMLGAEGKLTCLKTNGDKTSGDVVWEKSLTETYKTKTAIWGYSSHPLIDGDLLYTIAGGDGSIAIALNKHTGEEVWRALSAGDQGYNSPTMIEHAGVKQLLIWTPEALNSLEPKTGKVYWSLPLKPGFNMSIMGPRKLGSYLYASAIGNVSALMKLDDDKPGAEFVWKGNPKTSIFCSNATPFIDGEMLYGCDVETGALVGASLKDGKRLWQTTKATDNNKRRSRHATAFLVKHEDRYFLFNELGDLIIAKLSPEGYQEEGRFHVLEPTNEAFGRDVVWSHPAFANRSLFARNDEELVCVDLSK